MNLEKEMQEFSKAILQITSSKLIFAEKKIAFLLKVVADDECLYKTIQYALKGFDFELEFMKATLQNGEKKEFVLPNKSKQIVGIVFCLLCQFDQKITTISEFLQEYYYDLDLFSAYESFCKQIIAPFEKAFFELVQEIVEKKD